MIMTTTPETSTQQERDRAKELSAQGLSYEEVGQELGRATSTIHRWVTDYDYRCPSYKIQEWKGKSKQEEKDLAVETYLVYQSIPKVCEVMDRSYDTIYRWLKGAGIDTSQSMTKTKSSKKVRDGVRDKIKLEKKIVKLDKRIAELEAQNDELRNVVATLATFNQL